jgi:hypothetical protein
VDIDIDLFVAVLHEGMKSEMYVEKENVHYHFVYHHSTLDQLDYDFSFYYSISLFAIHHPTQ